MIQSSQETLQSLRGKIALDPASGEAHFNLGIFFIESGQHEEAIGWLQKAVQLAPGNAAGYQALGFALFRVGNLDEAIACFRQVLAMMPDFVDALFHLGHALYDSRHFEQSEDCFRRIIELSPSHANAHGGLAINLLLRGQFRDGWREFEWRWKSTDFDKSQRSFSAPRWDGSPAPGQTLLIHTEQGHGDAMQFLRYVPLVRERSGARRVILECKPALMKTLAHSGNWKASLVARADLAGTSLPRFDQHVPLLSLPHVLGLPEPTDPALSALPYLRSSPEKRKAWQLRLRYARAMRVGLVWSGNKIHPRDHFRSIPAEQLAALANVPNVTFFSLQQQRPGQEAPNALSLVDPTGQIADFSDTAALVSELDLVVTVDTAVAHLAGALGRPVWTLLQFAPDWRWGMDGDRTAWYPSMRLFRQRALGDWKSVLQEVAAQLEIQAARPGDRVRDSG